MKTSLLWFLIISVLMLGACAKSRTIDHDTFETTLMSLTFDTSLLMFNKLSETDDGPLDRILWLDRRDETMIKIHLMTNSENALLEIDQKILITDQYIYRQTAMTKEAHGINIFDLSATEHLIATMSPLYDPSMLSHAALLDVFHKAETITYSDASGTRTYRSTYVSEDDPEGTYTAWSVTYDKDNNTVLSVMCSRHHDRRSTYQESNMIESSSVYLNEPFPFEFPDLSLFS